MEKAGDEVSLHEILEILFKHKWVILASFVLVLAGVALYTIKQDPQYEARSTVYVNTQQPTAELGELLGLETFNRNIANEIEIVKSRKIAMRVADQLLDIAHIPGTTQPLPVLSTDEAGAMDPLEVTQRLQGSIAVQPVTRGVDIIEIVSTSTVPEEAALIATLYAQEYVEYNRLTSRSRMAASREFLDNVTDNYASELHAAEEDLTAFLNRERVVAPDEEARQLIEQVSSAEQIRSQAQLELGMLRAEIRTLEEQVEALKPGLASRLSSGDDRLLAGMVDELARLELEVEKKYAQNPALRQNASLDRELVQDLLTIQQLREQLEDRAKTVADAASQGADIGSSAGGTEGGRNALDALSNLRRQIMSKRIEENGLRARLELIEGQRHTLDGELRTIPRNKTILGRLERSRQTTEQLYVALEEKLQEVRIAEQSELGYVDIVDEGLVPEAPVRPRIQLNLLLGAVAGLVLGLGLAFARNAVDNKVRKPEDLRKHGHAVVSVIPNMQRVIQQDFKGKEKVVVDGHEYSTQLVSLLNPMSPVAEAYRRLRTNIQFSRPDSDLRLLMVTSPGPGEGKTVTTINLAITMAQAGRRTLYVDTDLRRPRGHHMLGIPREPGLVDLLFDALPDDGMERFATDLDSHLYVLPAGRDVPNPAEVLGSKKMQKLLARWRQEFDVILVDTPPTLVVADALILASQCDTTLVVCAAGDTNWEAVDRSVEGLKSVGADVLGVLLNRFDVKAAYGGYKYGYGYEYGYYNSSYYYGTRPEDQKESQKKKRGLRAFRSV